MNFTVMVMSRKKFILLVGIPVVLLIAGGTALFLLVKHRPAFYVESAVPPGKQRKELSSRCFGLLTRLSGNIIDGKGKWEVTFTQDEINSFFAEDFLRWGDADDLRRQGISEPRVVFDGDRIRLAFQYGSRPLWRTVVTFNVRAWLARGEVNVVALEILDRTAGAVPISAQSILDQIAEAAERNNIKLTWYRHNGNPVAVLRFQTNPLRPRAQLQTLRLVDNKLTIGGVSGETTQQVYDDTELSEFK